MRGEIKQDINERVNEKIHEDIHEKTDLRLEIGERLADTLLAIFTPPIAPAIPVRFSFNKVRDKKSGETIEGDIKTMSKKEFGWSADFEATPKGGAGADYEHGTAEWSYSATSVEDGSDVSDQFTVTPDPSNELKANVTHNGTQVNSTGVLTLAADGDPVAGPDDVAPVVGTLAITTGAPNVTGFDIAEVPA